MRSCLSKTCRAQFIAPYNLRLGSFHNATDTFVPTMAMKLQTAGSRVSNPAWASVGGARSILPARSPLTAPFVAPLVSKSSPVSFTQRLSQR